MPGRLHAGADLIESQLVYENNSDSERNAFAVKRSGCILREIKHSVKLFEVGHMMLDDPNLFLKGNYIFIFDKLDMAGVTWLLALGSELGVGLRLTLPADSSS